MAQIVQPVPNETELSAQSTVQSHLIFHLTGKRLSGELEPIDDPKLLPALLAAYRDLAGLRYDFPLVLIPSRLGEADGVKSLSGLVDAVLKKIADGNGERLKKQALRLEREIRLIAAERDVGLLSDLWEVAIRRLSPEVDDLLKADIRRFRMALPVDGVVVDCNATMPSRLCRNVWEAVQNEKARVLGQHIANLVVRLSNILRADTARSGVGRTAENLKASIGATHQHAFDFDALSRLLTDAAPPTCLSEGRRRRIESLLTTLTSQQFARAWNDDQVKSEPAEPSRFVFDNCAEAIAAYRERLPDMTELGKALAIAEREIEGEYNEANHDAIFAEFDLDSLDPATLNLFPDYLVCVRARDIQAEDRDRILDALAAGLPVKILFQIDDLLEPSLIAGSSLTFNWRNTQLASAAMGINTPYVLQASSSHLFQLRERVLDGMAHSGPALFSIFSGATAANQALPPYLIAAAAMESRAFPAFTYDPSAGSDWASRFQLQGNPQPDRDWPVQNLTYEDGDLQRRSECLAFTIVDFIACDPRQAKHFAQVPRSRWASHMVPLSEFLIQASNEPTENVPYLCLTDGDHLLQKVIVDEKMVREARHCAETWHSFQELGSIRSRQAPPFAQEQEGSAEQLQPPPVAEPVHGENATGLASAEPEIAAETTEPPQSLDEPYIETLRCTTCNECTQINDKMFAYNENKQAFIRDPDAGTYRQLVEAAESCQVAIIHPGRPRNPNEEGLDDLVRRAEPFR